MDIKEFERAIRKEVRINIGEGVEGVPQGEWIEFREPTQEEVTQLQFSVLPDKMNYVDGKPELNDVSKEQLMNSSKSKDALIKATMIGNSFKSGDKDVSKELVWKIITSKPELYKEVVELWTKEFDSPLEEEAEKE